MVTAFDANGNVATGFTGTVTVALAVNPGGGTLSGTLNVTAIAGVATFADLAIDRVGAGYTLVVSAPTLASATSVPFAITPAPATQLAFTGQPSNATQNGPIAPAVAVTAFDAFGNVDTSFGGPVTVAISPGTGTLGARLSGTTTVAASSGVATFGDLRIDSSGTSYALDAAATGLGSATSEAFAVVPAAVELRITAQPTGAQAGASIAPPVVVTAFDGTGAVATGFSGTVTVALGANPTGGTLSGTRTVTAIAGHLGGVIGNPDSRHQQRVLHRSRPCDTIGVHGAA
jgi:hypothetical protein